MRKFKIDVTKIKKDWLFESQKVNKEGKRPIYLDATEMDNRDGTDQYGNDGFILQNPPQELREQGQRGIIIGNWRNVKPKGESKRAPAQPPQDFPPRHTEDDVPF
jgi:hypothetical protein